MNYKECGMKRSRPDLSCCPNICGQWLRKNKTITNTDSRSPGQYFYLGIQENETGMLTTGGNVVRQCTTRNMMSECELDSSGWRWCPMLRFVSTVVNYLTNLAVIGTVFYRIHRPPPISHAHHFSCSKNIHFKIEKKKIVVMYSFKVYGRKTCIFIPTQCFSFIPALLHALFPRLCVMEQ
jgi:hypothetical protein